jgi:CheY-like chemotaxis protein
MLLVNDQPFLIDCYLLQLEQYFYIEVAENGLQAMQIVQSHDVDFFNVIMLDINMPIMDGLEACERMKNYLYEDLMRQSNSSPRRIDSG